VEPGTTRDESAGTLIQRQATARRKGSKNSARGRWTGPAKAMAATADEGTLGAFCAKCLHSQKATQAS